MTDYQRIEKVLDFLNLNARELSIALEMKSPQTFYDIKKGKCGVSKKLAEKIQAKFKHINSVWLLTGEGEMLTTDTAQPLTTDTTEPQTDTPEQRELDMLRQMLADRDATIAHLNRHIGAITSQLDTLLAIHTPTDTPTDDLMA